jgi:sigma-B regulation protein RsbU (phosphoserine phosphatase)
LSIANAGHNPVLHFVKKDSECRLIDISSCALNIAPDFDYNSEKVKVNSGDIILIYTDGINEAVNRNNDMFSISRLCDIIEKNGQISAEEMVQTIRKQVEDFSDSLEQADDMVLIAIKIF